MKKTTAFVSLLGLVVFGCLNDSPGKKRTGEANVLIKLQKVGALHKAAVTADIEMSALYLNLSAIGETAILDTLPLSGSVQNVVSKAYSGLASGKTWTLTAAARDDEDVTVHSGSTEFTVPPNGIENVSLTLAAQYSMLKARFFPIRDSVTRVELLVDGGVVANFSFPKQSRLGDTVVLSHDHLPASPGGTAHTIRLDAYGDHGGASNVLLYRGDTSITVVSGQDKSYGVTLNWVGPLSGQAQMSVTLGASGTVLVDGWLPLDETTGADWLYVGTPGFSPTNIKHSPSLALSSDDVPYVAFADWGSKATVMRWNGTAWVNVGAPGGFSTGEVSFPSLALSSADLPYVAFADWTNDGKVTVMRWNGTAWVNVGAPGFSAGAVAGGPATECGYGGSVVNCVSLVLSSDDVPYVVFRSMAHQATVMRWNGTAWANVGAPGFSVEEVLGGDVSLALSGDGEPYIAFRDGVTGEKATVMQWKNELAWVYVGTPGFSAGQAWFISLALSGDSVPYVAFHDGANGGKATVMRWNGTAWVNVGTPGFSAAAAYRTSLVVSGDGVPYVAFREGSINGKATVMRWNGTAWVNVGTPGFPAAETWFTSLALSSANVPYVAFVEKVVIDIWASVMRFGQP